MNPNPRGFADGLTRGGMRLQIFWRRLSPPDGMEPRPGQEPLRLGACVR